MQSIKPYNDHTYVAFIDISGFKNVVRNRDDARNTLDKFYNTLHQIRNMYATRNNDKGGVVINLLAVSDCAIIFTRNRYPKDKTMGLRSILNFIRFFNRRMINPDICPRILTTCSIGYGKFIFEKRMPDEGIAKSFFYGDGYLDVYLDNSDKQNILNVGECRIIGDLIDNELNVNGLFNPLSYIKKRYNNTYFYWMLDNIDDVDEFKNEYYFDGEKNDEYYEQKKDILYKYCYGQ